MKQATNTPPRRIAQAFNGNGYHRLHQMAVELGRPVGTLLALASDNDPFFADREQRRHDAQWFAKLWRRLHLGAGVHLRRIHYVLVSQDKPISSANGEPYVNTTECWKALAKASRDARYLGLVPIEDFVDRRNDEVIERLGVYEQPAALSIEDPNLLPTKIARPWVPNLLPSPPDFVFSKPVIDQRYHVELWAEKTTMNDILVDLADGYGLNVVTASGEISITACYQLVQRAKEISRPVRILYISDFDPAGMSIPLAAARKIEFLIHKEHLDLDVQLRPVALTHEQCKRYRLPRTPIKETERRAGRFEARFGEGATELDALEALRPGVLVEEIERYHDDDIDQRVDAAARKIDHELAALRTKIIARHRANLDAVRKELRGTVGRCNAELSAVAKRQATAYQKIGQRFNKLQKIIAAELQRQAPDLDLVDWPEPADGIEDDDPLFDSSRGYIEQIDRFKMHQGKPTERRAATGEH